MPDVVRWFKNVAAAAGSAFGGSWAAIASLVGALKVDVSAGKQVVLAAAASGFAAVAMAVANWVKQLREKAKGWFDAGSAEADALLAEARGLIDEARGFIK